MQKIHTYDKILFPIVTEKSTSLSEQNKIVFRVPVKSNKNILSLPVDEPLKIFFVIELNLFFCDYNFF